MNKEIFLRDLRRFLADIPEEEREQALKYYEDYFEDAGPENEQKVIAELGSPIDIAKQIKSTNQENISYGQGNSFYRNNEYPNIYEKAANSENSSGGYSHQSYGNNYNQYQQPKKSWTQDSGKVTIVVILAILAIPVGIPLVSTIFGILIAIAAIVFSLIISLFAIGFSLAIAGIFTIIASFFSIGSVASAMITSGIGLILFSIGIFIFWFDILFCGKFVPTLFSGIGKCFSSIGRGIHSFFN